MSAESWVPVDLYNQLPDFTGRGWAIDRVRAWLDGESGTALLVRGGPGTGKSLLAARLVTSLSDAITYGHFCRFNTADTDPLVFVERLAAALANRYPAALQALTVDPFVSVVVSGTANVGHALPGATVAGTQLGALHIHALAPRLAFNRAVRRAVEAIRTAGITDEIVVLVDALDECGAEPDTIAGLLHDVLDPQARPPDGLRLILTSRPDPRLLHGTDVAVLDLVEDEPESGSDITAYVHRMLDQLPADRRDALAAEVIAVSAGNFLYTRYVVLDLVAGRTDRLPKGLQGVYANFFRRELARSPERWSERYRPLLGLLVVARGNGLTNEWLARSSGLPQSHVDDALRGCAQYLAGPVPDGPVRLYHHSLRDYLLGAGPHQVYPDEAQDALITALLANPCDDYALAHLPEHLAASGRVAELTTLLTNLNFLAAKTARYGIDAILANLRVGGSPNLLRAMERAAHQIRGRDTPGLFVQQVLAAANDLNDTELVNRARTWLADRKLSFVETIWRTGTPSPGLRYVLVPPGEHIMTSEVSVSADWRHVAAAGLRNNIGVWDFDTGIMQWQLDRDVITGALALALSPDGRLLAAGEHVVTVWDTVANHKMWETPKLPSRAKSLAFSSDGVLLLGQVGQKVLVWNSDTGLFAVFSGLLSVRSCTRVLGW
jgi:hypothetical protein